MFNIQRHFSDWQHTQANELAHVLVNAHLYTNPACHLFSSVSSFGYMTEISFLIRAGTRRGGCQLTAAPVAESHPVRWCQHTRPTRSPAAAHTALATSPPPPACLLPHRSAVPGAIRPPSLQAATESPLVNPKTDQNYNTRPLFYLTIIRCHFLSARFSY
jgi:hypothetical protein